MKTIVIVGSFILISVLLSCEKEICHIEKGSGEKIKHLNTQLNQFLELNERGIPRIESVLKLLKVDLSSKELSITFSQLNNGEIPTDIGLNIVYLGLLDDELNRQSVEVKLKRENEEWHVYEFRNCSEK